MRLSKNGLRLTQMENLRDKLNDLDRSASFLPSIFGRDEGCREAMVLLDEIETEFREKMDSDQGRELRKVVDKTLDQMDVFVRCRKHRREIKTKFSGEKADRRIQRLDDREAKIRSYVRKEWDVGRFNLLSEDDLDLELEAEGDD
ncbi:hypothetical protein GGP48_002289 [Salinibacter ruber]|uniref:hypothetical protein n=2 Tax=Salinibacter ruber TaxID=146919 RepID=UPI00216918CC|nr:hypothetical protein [Salinibacter ruber]MCS4187586.1 hypothetical protein [Salinibacter ruber]